MLGIVRSKILAVNRNSSYLKHSDRLVPYFLRHEVRQASTSIRSNVDSNEREGYLNGKKITVDRELPDPFVKKYENYKYFVGYGIGVIISCIIIFNYEKTTSPILNSVFYFLRRSPKVTDRLGDDIKYNRSWPWISGELNTVKGDIDIHFDIKGDKDTGTLYFKASRENKRLPFVIHHWYLVIDKEIIDLKESDSIDFGF